jgi:hypothetical protein
MDYRLAARMVAGIAVTAAAVVACSTTVDGNPVAGPDTSALSTVSPTTPSSTSPSTATRTTPPGAPTVPSVPTRTATPGAPAADTTCDEYINLDEAAQREVITAVAADNQLVSLNPELWVTLTSALCTFAEPSTPVRDVLAGQGIR